MKMIRSLTCGLLAILSTQLLAQTVPLKGGSDGSDGPLILSDSEDRELALPPDGVFNFTTITIGEFSNLTFRRNAMNSPVYLLATGDVVIEGNINVWPPFYHNSESRRIGGPGGFDGGFGGVGNILPGPGFGPGGGLPKHQVPDAKEAGDASHSILVDDSSDFSTRGAVYGNKILIPIIGGSGGAGRSVSNARTDAFGAGGGGAIVVASSTRIFMTSSGDIHAEGGNDGNTHSGGDGSGGAIRLIAPVIEGSGDLHVNGSLGGGPGRIRIDSLVRVNMNLNLHPREVASFGSNLVVFPDVLPRLSILEAAGRLIPDNSTAPVSVTLAPGAPEQQTVKVRARDFDAEVKIAVVLTPNSGERQIFQATIDNRNQNPAEIIVPVNVIANVQTFIHVWTVGQ
jgi:hypothetical protein